MAWLVWKRRYLVQAARKPRILLQSSVLMELSCIAGLPVPEVYRRRPCCGRPVFECGTDRRTGIVTGFRFGSRY